MLSPTGGAGGKDRPLEVGDTPIITLVNSAVCFLAAATAVVGGVSWLLNAPG